MKIKSRTKIICDICGEEIPRTIRNHIQVTEYVPYIGEKCKKRKWDICQDCADEMKGYIKAVYDVKKRKAESEG